MPTHTPSERAKNQPSTKRPSKDNPDKDSRRAARDSLKKANERAVKGR